MSTPSFSTASIKTSDGVTLRYISAGPANGPTLLFIPGWAQTAIQWHKQISYFSNDFRVLAIDHRGQGDSEQATGGYRISRLAADLNDVITQLDLKDAVLVGHSMGCSVLWAVWNTYTASRSRIAKLVLVDQTPVMIANPAWEDGLAQSLGAAFSPMAAYEVAAGLIAPDGVAVATGLMKTLFSPHVGEADFAWTMQQVTKMDTKNASTLFVNHAGQDWRDVLSTITVPTLIIGGELSLFSKAMGWIAKQIPGAKLKMFGKDEGGSHFMFWENDKGFNEALAGFLED